MKLKKDSYFKHCGFSWGAYYLGLDRDITRLHDGVFITGLFNPNDDVHKISHSEAINMVKEYHKSN